MDIWNGAIEKISGIKGLYDFIRIVDPFEKRVICGDLEHQREEVRCYEFWDKGEICSNCTAARAIIEGDNAVKLEMSNGRLYFITSSPLNLKGKNYVVELIRDITHSKEFKTENCYLKVGSLTKRLNDSIIMDKLTGIYNRSYIKERLPVDIYFNHINNIPISLAACKVTNYEDIICKYGNAAGDLVLKETSKIITDNLKSEMNWSGTLRKGIFLIVLNTVTKELAEEICSKIRFQINNYGINYEDNLIQITSDYKLIPIQEEIVQKDIRAVFYIADKAY
ncbi:GGDEF domain-containing protein [Clostridium polynesiense]|uniref:GGDEF domain-containing protein n=1 Tax=Clostridium polynesiense TaxID=1325933 RepID=UPI000590DEFF|nr:GGDEF domain-containing protein [Clostridium polynesiense]